LSTYFIFVLSLTCIRFLSANLKRIKSQYTDSAVQRCNLNSGTIGKRLEEKFRSQVVDKYIGRSKFVHVSHKRDFNMFVKVYKGECLFQHVTGRHHSAYEHFVHHIPPKSPSNLKDRLVKYGVLTQRCFYVNRTIAVQDELLYENYDIVICIGVW
jgi:hypothetical protein